MSIVDFDNQLAPITEQFGAKLNIGGSDRDEAEEQSPDEEFSFSSARFDLVVEDDIGPIFPFFGQTPIAGDEPRVKKVLVETPEGTYRESAGTSVCGKSNSTGFSTMWRSREMEHRSNSDGRDAFLFLRDGEGRERGPAKGHEGSTNKKGKGKTGPCSAHEVHYVKSRERKEKDRMRSYLPYRTGLFGFFTNVRGGLTKNVHPY